MNLLLIRHATAVPRGTAGIPDAKRPLTEEGQAEFLVAARGLVRIVQRPDVLLTSPLLRARVTAEIAARAFDLGKPRREPALARGSVDAIVAALKPHPAGATVALVGHEPLLGELLARLLGASPDARLAFEKGGAALVDLPDGPSSAGRLVWFLGPRILRTLAGQPEVRHGSAPPANPSATASGTSG